MVQRQLSCARRSRSRHPSVCSTTVVVCNFWVRTVCFWPRQRPREAMTLPPAPPSAVEAEAAGKRFIGLGQMFHPICFCCTETLAPGYGLRVFTGQTDGAPAGHVSGGWSALPPFGDADGLTPTAVIWAAIDCPGSVAW